MAKRVNKNNDVAWTGDAQNDIDKVQISDNNIRALDDNKIINNRESVESTQVHTIKRSNPSGKLIKLLSKKASVEAVSSINIPDASVIVLDRTSFNNNNTAAVISGDAWKFSRLISFQDNVIDVYHRKGRRLNGLQLPLHPLQLLGWIVLFLFGLATYWLLIPSFTTDLQEPLYGLIGGLYLVHVVSHLIALLIDPADRELRRLHRNDRIIPEFDRSKHAHVIENGRCHLCNIRTSSEGTKHCSVCNKCVGKFDHHCKWLNHCIGSRNYVAFLMCVVSAVCATLVILAAVVAQFVLYYTKPQWLNFWHNVDHYKVVESISQPQGEKMASSDVFFRSNENSSTNDSVNLEISPTFSANVTKVDKGTHFFTLNDTTLSLLGNVTTLITEAVNERANQSNSTYESPLLILQNNTENQTLIAYNSTTISFAGLTINQNIFWVVIGCLGILAAVTAGLLLHLCFFHIYISFLGLTTYEYIRNHRQTQETKANQLISANNLNNESLNEDESLNNHLTKKTNDCAEIYFCSSVHHPNDSANSEMSRGAENEVHTYPGGFRRLKLHCCANSREYHQTSSKIYYMCSLLEETSIKSPLQISQVEQSTSTEIPAVIRTEKEMGKNFRTYHCCSAFTAAASQRRVSAAASKATLVSNLKRTTATLSAHRSYLQYAERCTFCTFRLRSPAISKKDTKCSLHKSHRSEEGNQRKEVKTYSNILPIPDADNSRCCMKSISKHQRWRRKWNCCVGVPDSPDVPNDLITSLSIKHEHEMATNKYSNSNVTTMHFENAKSVSGAAIKAEDPNRTGLSIIHPNSPVRDKAEQTRLRSTRAWPIARFRHIMRALHRYKRSTCRHQNFSSSTLGEQVKQNQICPLHLQVRSNGEHLYSDYYGASSPQSLFSTTNILDTGNERSNITDPSDLNTSSNSATFKTSILPTSIIRDETSVTYTTPVGTILPPVLPPPVRRKIRNPTDLDELTETLRFASNPSNNTNNHLTSFQRLPVVNNLYRRQRRKHFLRTRSPTLSPIHESGLSNPTSPQPYRHNVNSCSPSSSPIVMNKFCSVGSSELNRKTSSNSSLRSDSSSSSSN
ncbi:dihydrouridine synthase 1 isoform 2-T8 [Glossina fuscipes fuscipes]